MPFTKEAIYKDDTEKLCSDRALFIRGLGAENIGYWFQGVQQPPVGSVTRWCAIYWNQQERDGWFQRTVAKGALFGPDTSETCDARKAWIEGAGGFFVRNIWSDNKPGIPADQVVDEVYIGPAFGGKDPSSVGVCEIRWVEPISFFDGENKYENWVGDTTELCDARANYIRGLGGVDVRQFWSPIDNFLPPF